MLRRQLLFTAAADAILRHYATTLPLFRRHHARHYAMPPQLTPHAIATPFDGDSPCVFFAYAEMPPAFSHTPLLLRAIEALAPLRYV